MDKIEIIARRILGWKLNKWNKWFDFEKGISIQEFEPEQNLEHAMLIVEKLKELGFTYTINGAAEVCFDGVCAVGDTLAQAITNAAFILADNSSIDEEWL